MAKETQTTAEYQANEVLALLDESLFDLVSSGISRVDFANVHTELLALQPRLLSYSTQQQAFYWQNLAICSRQLILPSDQVLPHIQQALSFAPKLKQQQHFKILDKAIELAMTYQHYELLLNYIEQLRQLSKDQLDPVTLRLPEEYENLRARALYQTGQLVEAELSLTLLIDEAEQKSSPQNVNWYSLLSSIHQTNKESDKQISVLRKQLELFPSLNREQYLAYLLKNETK